MNSWLTGFVELSARVKIRLLAHPLPHVVATQWQRNDARRAPLSSAHLPQPTRDAAGAVDAALVLGERRGVRHVLGVRRLHAQRRLRLVRCRREVRERCGAHEHLQWSRGPGLGSGAVRARDEHVRRGAGGQCSESRVNYFKAQG